MIRQNLRIPKIELLLKWEKLEGKNHFLLFLIILRISLPNILLGETSFPDKPIHAPSQNELLIIENSTYCHAGFGGQDYNLQAGRDKKTHHSKDQNGFFNPDMENSTYFSLGCSLEQFFLDYAISEIFLTTKNSFIFRNKIYNRVNLHLETVILGYAWTLWEQYLYFNSGVGIAHTEFNYLFEDSLNKYSSETQQENFNFYSVGLRQFLSPSFFIQWKLEQAFTKNIVLPMTNTLAFHFFRRFD